MDGSAFVYRGFYANQSMQRSDGFPTSALFIVARILMRILREEQPRHFAFVLDGHGPNFRHELFPLYKAQRSATPEDLIKQIDPIHRLIKALGLHLEVSDSLRGGRLPRLACQALPRGTPGDPRGYRQGPQAVPA